MLKTTLIVLNIVVGVGLLGIVAAASVVKGRRKAVPANLARHYEDPVLENQHLSRVLGWALVLTTVVAISLPVYWLLVPLIQERHDEAFLERSIAFGAEQFAIESPTPGVALACASCHGSDGSGGSVTQLYADSVTGKNYSLPWTAPALNTVFYRFPREQIKTVIVYGRKGTPMQAWGLAGSGPVNDQGIEDILNYIESIQLSPADMTAQLTEQIRLQKAENPTASDGQILFEVNCARCHTEGWSQHAAYAQPVKPDGTGGAGQPLPMVAGGGAYGPSLTNGRVERQFPDPAAQAAFIGTGSVFQQQYGIRGIGSGGMPGFARQCDTGQVLEARDCRILTDDQINEIVAYERGLEEPEQGAEPWSALVGITNILVAQAHGGGGNGLWDPKLKGYVVVISAVGLFCGSVYLLLWTNVGSSIGFLLAGAAIAGIGLMLSTLWVTGQFPNGYLGTLPKWNVTEVLTADQGVAASDVGKIRDIANGGVPEASQAIAGQIKADLDAEIAGETASNKLFTVADDYQAVKTYQVGGARKMPIWWSKKPEYAAVEVCTLTKAPADYDELNNPPFVRECDPTIANQTIVLHHDLGSLRLPAAYTMAGSAILLAGFLYGLYLVELRQRQAADPPPGETAVPATT